MMTTTPSDDAIRSILAAIADDANPTRQFNAMQVRDAWLLHYDLGGGGLPDWAVEALRAA